MSLFVVKFGLQADQFLGFVGALMSLPTLLLPFPLVMVEAVAMPLAVQLNVFVLRLHSQKRSGFESQNRIILILQNYLHRVTYRVFR